MTSYHITSHHPGIRFVYFSREDELQSRAFAQKLGLETGFNCYVSLSERDQACVLSEQHQTKCMQCYVSESENRAHLPRGLPAIRDHLKVMVIGVNVGLMVAARG